MKIIKLFDVLDLSFSIFEHVCSLWGKTTTTRLNARLVQRHLFWRYKGLNLSLCGRDVG